MLIPMPAWPMEDWECCVSMPAQRRYVNCWRTRNTESMSSSASIVGTKGTSKSCWKTSKHGFKAVIGRSFARAGPPIRQLFSRIYDNQRTAQPSLHYRRAAAADVADFASRILTSPAIEPERGGERGCLAPNLFRAIWRTKLQPPDPERLDC